MAFPHSPQTVMFLHFWVSIFTSTVTFFAGVTLLHVSQWADTFIFSFHEVYYACNQIVIVFFFIARNPHSIEGIFRFLVYNCDMDVGVVRLGSTQLQMS